MGERCNGEEILEGESECGRKKRRKELNVGKKINRTKELNVEKKINRTKELNVGKKINRTKELNADMGNWGSDRRVVEG